MLTPTLTPKTRSLLLTGMLFASFYFGGNAALASHLTCTNSQSLPNTDLRGFSYDVQVPVSAGGGGSAGKPTYAFSVVVPLNATYGSLSQMAINGTHSSTCVLTEPANSSTTIEITMKDVVFSDLNMLSGTFFTPNAPGPLLQLKLTFASATTQVN